MGNFNAIDEFNFLWEKWKHHDALLHQRQNAFWTIQAILIALITIIVDKVIGSTGVLYLRGIVFIGSGMFFIIAAVFGFSTINGLRMDRLCRDNFNPRIRELLLEKTTLFGSQDAQGNLDPPHKFLAHAKTIVASRTVQHYENTFHPCWCNFGVGANS